MVSGSRPATAEIEGERRGLQELVAAVEAVEWVLIHCSAGIRRTGMMAFVLLPWLGTPEGETLGLIGAMGPETREGMRPEHIRWGNEVAAAAGRG